MTKNELIEELQKIKGNPQISIAIDRTWGKESYSAIKVTPLYNHCGHKVDPEACIFEVNAEATPEQIEDSHKLFLIKKYGPLTLCSIDERYWAVNGPWFEKQYQEKIECLETKIARLEKEREKILNLDEKTFLTFKKMLQQYPNLHL